MDSMDKFCYLLFIEVYSKLGLGLGQHSCISTP